MRLAAIVEAIAGWAAPAPDATVFLFGSRVRGDNHDASDLDVFVDVSRVTTRAAVQWWSDNNSDGFAALRALVPFRVEVLHPDDGLAVSIRSAPVVEAFGNVRCVAMPPVKPRADDQRFSHALTRAREGGVKYGLGPGPRA